MSERVVQALLEEASSAILAEVALSPLQALILLIERLVGEVLGSVNLAQSRVISVQKA